MAALDKDSTLELSVRAGVPHQASPVPTAQSVRAKTTSQKAPSRRNSAAPAQSSPLRFQALARLSVATV